MKSTSTALDLPAKKVGSKNSKGTSKSSTTQNSDFLEIINNKIINKKLDGSDECKLDIMKSQNFMQLLDQALARYYEKLGVVEDANECYSFLGEAARRQLFYIKGQLFA